MLQNAESIMQSTKSWMEEYLRRRTNASTELHGRSAAEPNVYCRPSHEQDDIPAAVESFRKVFMISALTGDGVEDLRVMLLGH